MGKDRNQWKSFGLKVAYKSVLFKIALNMAPAPVEEKGYKSMINLPDWISVSYFISKFQKSFENERILSWPVLLSGKKMDRSSSISGNRFMPDMLNMACLNWQDNFFLSLTAKTPDRPLFYN
jgi:hypothetical protein